MSVEDWDPRVKLAYDATNLLLTDISAIGMPIPRVEIADDPVCIVINGGSQTPSFFEHERGPAIVEIADYFQEQLDTEAWPLCPTHGYGLHAEVHDKIAVWFCRFGQHVVAPVGAFPKR